MCNCSGGYYYYSSLNFLSEGTSENYTSLFTWTRLDKSNTETLLLLMGVHANKGARTQLLRYCATSRKVAGSIPGGVIGVFS